MARNLSDIVAEVFARPAEGKGLSHQVRSAGEELRKAVHGDETISGKLLVLLDSLRTILPDERQRYQAALQAVSSTEKLSRPEIIIAMNAQLEELRTIELRMAATGQAWRDSVKSMQVRSQQLKGEIAQLRERVGRLESEERAAQADRSAQDQGLTLAEKAMKDLFSDIGEEVRSLNKKIEDWTTEIPAALRVRSAPPQASPAAQPKAPARPASQTVRTKGVVHGRKKTGARQKAETQGASPAAAPGPAMVPTASDVEPVSASPSVSRTVGSKKEPSRTDSQPAVAKKKSCPVCYKKMVWFPGEKVWRCPSGHHETKGGSGAGSKR